MCQFYNSNDEAYEILISYIKAGLASNELCIWVYSSDKVYKQIQNSFDRYGFPSEEYIKNGQLQLISLESMNLIYETTDGNKILNH